MTTPSVDITQQDNQLGVRLPGDNLLAIIGCSSAGDINVPTICTRTKQVRDTFGTGPLVEELCTRIDLDSIAVIAVRADETTVGGYGAIDDADFAGTSAVTADTGDEPYDDYEIAVRFITGTVAVGTTGATYQYSIDGELTWSATLALGTAPAITIAECRATFDLDTGTILASDVFRCRTSAPKWDVTDVQAALTALRNFSSVAELVHITGACDATDVAAFETAALAFGAASKEITVLCSARRPAVGESAATYRASLSAAFSAVAAPYTSVAAGDCRIVSSTNGKRMRRPAMSAAAGRIATIGRGRDAAAFADGALHASITITDSFGNPDSHDETVSPGLDDARFLTLRTWTKTQGVFINNPRLMSATGSDFTFIQHRRVMNHACAIVRDGLRIFSSDDVLVAPLTGYILEEEAVAIEAYVLAGLQALVGPEASAVAFTLSRSDNLLSTFTLRGQARATPLAYLKKIAVDISYYNPALRVVVAEAA